MLDTPFDNEYSGITWERENILRVKNRYYLPVGRSDQAPDDTPDIVTIRNNSTRNISLMILKARDLVFAFDIASGSGFEVVTPPQRPWADLSWIKVEGMWSDGQRLPPTGINFVLPKRATGQFKYVVGVWDSSVNIREVQQGAELYR